MAWSEADGSLALHTLLPLYRDGSLTPSMVIGAVYDRIAAAGDDAVWIAKVPRDRALARARALELGEDEAGGSDLPLFGVPFAVKDCFDVAGMPTTAACPAFAYTADRTAFVVERLEAAGAILVGKTNLDQFASGLVGVRSPYGACRCPFDRTRISGGSSSGSAVAVATGLVGFALGTDVAGSGRVPAAFTNTVGLKPSHGLLSVGGTVPACRSLDHVSVFALTVADAAAVLSAAAGYDPADPYSDPGADRAVLRPAARSERSFRFGVPAAADLRFFDDTAMAAAYEAALGALTALGGQRIEIDYAPFREAGALLYGGPWLAERYAYFRDFLARCPDAVHPVTRTVLEGGARFTAAEAFTALHRRQELRRQAASILQSVDLLALPTAGMHPSFAAIEANPIALNFDLGYYTQFVNLLGYCVAAVPAAFRTDGLPFGLSLIASAGGEAPLFGIAAALHHRAGRHLGATPHPVPPPPAAAAAGSETR